RLPGGPSQTMRLLLVEDDRMIGESIRTALRQDGNAVDWVRDGRSAESTLATENFDLVLLDLGLPQRDGLEILRAMRLRHDQTPVILLTARDALQDRVAGLDAGADDYLVKPFELEELAARIRAVTRRKAGRGAPLGGVPRGRGGGAEPAVEIGEVRFDPSMRQVTRGGEPVVLSAREYA